MTHISQFLGEEADLGPEKRITILSAPLASSVSWLGGTELGPRAIIDASPALEVFDDELLAKPCVSALKHGRFLILRR
ncbi:MAG: hypothetical protein V1782_10685 [Pseudomonadota bacterium]